MNQRLSVLKTCAVISAFGVFVAGTANAQTQYPSAVQKHLDAATLNADGDQDLINYIRRNSCFEVEDNTWRTWARSHIGQTVPLLQMFDDLWFVGDKYTGMYFLKTADGGVLMIDALNNSADADSVILPALKQIGLPLRGVYISHGHGDHDGGVNRLRQVLGFNFPVFLGSGDVPGKAYQPTPIDSNSDAVQPVTIGGTTLLVQAAPGHTPGNQISLIPVHKNGVRHLLVMNWRSAVPGTASGSKQYVEGVEKVYAMAKAHGAVGFVHTHPISDATLPTINTIMGTGSRESIPLIFGAERTTRATAVARECSVARAQQIDATATFPVWRVTSVTFLDSGPALKKVSARLDSGWGPVIGQEVNFTVESSGSACRAMTDKEGVAECKSQMTIRSGETVRASFAGASTAEFVDLPSERMNTVRSPACTAGASGRTPPGKGLNCQ
jgi:hypothetical protein